MKTKKSLKTSNSRKRIVILPSDFQEVLILHEMKFEKEPISVDIVRKLVYLYSLGMEYYDSINRSELYTFYFEKSNRLLQDAKVIEVLDKNCINFKESGDIKLFKNDPYHIVRAGIRRKSMSEQELQKIQTKGLTDELSGLKDPEVSDRLHYSNAVGDDNKTLQRHYTMQNIKLKKGENKLICQNKVRDEFSNLNLKLNKINENISKDISQQMSNFELLKKKKLEHQNSQNKIKLKKYLSRTSYKFNDDKTNYSSNPSTINEDEILRETLFKQQKESAINSMMLKEIEDYIEKNMKEMDKALEEIRLSFEEEIESVCEDIFPEVVRGLREDMKSEIDNLREQYEEQRRNEVEKIRTKYLKQKNSY